MQVKSSLEERMTPEERELFERYKAQLGQEFSPPFGEMLPGEGISLASWGRDATRSWITRWAVANDDFNALWFDDDYARDAGWGGAIAPPLYFVSAEPYPPTWRGAPARELLDAEGRPRTDKYPTFVSPFEVACEWEFFEPARPGDQIDCKVKAADIFWKQGKQYRLLFLKDETTFTNQRGQVLARSRDMAVYRWR